MARNLFMILVILTGTAFVSFGQDSRQSFTTLFNSGGNIVWSINSPNDGGTVTISTPGGDVIRREFKAGASPVFTNEDRLAAGDGSYKFEIVLTPRIPESVREALSAAREAGNADEVYENFVRSGIIPGRMMETGNFRVVNGMIYTADSGPEPESSAIAAPRQTQIPDQKTNSVKADRGDVPPDNVQVINDDLIVVGSQCIGFDCVNTEAFNFDTLRLKENNLRINFEDTSNTASFPTNDWRIVANDTTNGGANYLAFEDTDAGNQPFRVEAGAGNAALWISDSGGNVGLGTTTPVVELHIVDGDTPTLRLEQNTSSGFTAQTWDVVGNESNFTIRDITNGSKLPFRIFPGAGSNSLVVAANNNVGIGVLSPAERLDVAGNIQADGDLIIKSGSTGKIVFADGTMQSTAGGPSGESNTASNIGAGAGIFAQKNGVDLEFKSLSGGTGITLTPGTDTVTVSTDAQNNTASNVGAGGVGIFNQKTGANLEFKRLIGGSNISITPTATNEVQISTNAELNTASNVGVVGSGVFARKTGSNLEFKRLQAGTNVSIVETASDEIRINSLGEVNTASNVGTGGIGVFKQKTGSNLEFKKILGGDNVTVSMTANDEVKIDAASPSFLGSAYSTHLMAGNGTILPGFSSAAVVDLNSGALTVAPGGGTTIVRFNIQGNSNLADTGAAFVVFKVRYIDSDGFIDNARVTISTRTSNINANGNVEDVIFDSNTFDATSRGFSTVTVCRPGNTLFNLSDSGTWLSATLTSTAGRTASLLQIQLYKSSSCL